jgi:hypothetical protein
MCISGLSGLGTEIREAAMYLADFSLARNFNAVLGVFDGILGKRGYSR